MMIIGQAIFKHPGCSEEREIVITARCSVHRAIQTRQTLVQTSVSEYGGNAKRAQRCDE